jgi:hypothetical protein
MVKIIQSNLQLFDLLSDEKTLFLQSDKILPEGFNTDLKKSCLERAIVFGCSNYFDFIPNQDLMKALNQSIEINVYSNIYEGIKKSKQILFHGRTIDDVFLRNIDSDIYFLKNGETLKSSDKKHFYSRAEEFEIPVLPYTFISANDSFVILRMLRKSQLFIQETNNSGGRGNYLITSEQEVETLPKNKQLIVTPYIEKEKIEKNASFFGWMNKENLNIEYIVGQKTENLIYSGSSFPIKLNKNDKKQLDKIFKGITSYLISEKYEGPVGFDLLKVNKAWYAMDPNLRLTASFFPYYIGKTLNHTSWESIEIDTETIPQEKVFSGLKQANLGTKIMPYFMQDNLFLFLYVGQEDNNRNKINFLESLNLEK